MKKIVSLMLALVITLMCASCAASVEKTPLNVEPQVSQMKAICELAVMDCYYHNVAKLTEEAAHNIFGWKWPWQKSKHFWIEYSGVVKLGIDVSLVSIEIKDTQVTITLPEAKVLNCEVDSTSLTEDSYIVDKDSADIRAADQIKAFKEAQIDLGETASSDKALLADAQQRAQDLLAGYISNIGAAVGKDYTIKWIYVDSNRNPASTSTVKPDAEPTPEATQ
ncbi:DUF4230 domain-containing protein [Intestinimonas massiliensis]|uniref:DUF4230 domain-containing protein n=1 Tax=Intestinimonas massiliensis (ex Afouda et al. 2020) TaxID=1673721 RepID=A0AAW5JGP1_9FIRM|nr:DUF4230 domain-containing protein [Intestinimonas massiliensis (ex Afouda et al. 2020)]MCQ4768977.1 DUF4230 domain-containing protein [Intestinimonas massiliensis (ex Afouda et al. 2020)]